MDSLVARLVAERSFPLSYQLQSLVNGLVTASILRREEGRSMDVLMEVQESVKSKVGTVRCVASIDRKSTRLNSSHG